MLKTILRVPSDFYMFQKTMDPVGQELFFEQNINQDFLYAIQKGFKLKSQFEIFNNSRSKELLWTIKANSMFDSSAVYDVIINDDVLFSLHRHYFKSAFIKDEWEITHDGEIIGTIEEEGKWIPLIRRWSNIVSYFKPQKYNIDIQGSTIATICRPRFSVLKKFIVSYKLPHESNNLILISSIVLLGCKESRD